MRSGTVELPSGRWDWMLLPQWTGATIVFQHRERVHDEMRSWTPEQELTEAAARELARDALERIWMDVDGLKWRLSMELPSGWQREARGRAQDEISIWLVFRRGGLQKKVALPSGHQLGDLSHTQLMELLEKAWSSHRGIIP